MNLSLATAAFFSALVELALGVGMSILWLRQKSRYLIYWSAGFLLFGVGALLISSRDKVPDFFSILCANLGLTLSSILFHIGICLFFNRRRSWVPLMMVVLVLEIALLAYYSYVIYDTTARVYVYSTAQALIALMTLQTLFTVGKERGESVNPEVVVVTILFLVGHSVRMVGTAFIPVPQDFLAAGNFQTLLAFGLMLIHINYALAFGNMHASALHADLSTALAEAEKKDRQKVELLGYIGHDLRAPLATIHGYSALLLADAHEKQRKLLMPIQRSVKYQLDLIDEVLEYAKSELQPLAVEATATDLLNLLDDISEYAIALCSQQNNRFRYHTSDRMPRQVVLDGKRLQQVLLNLLSNAAKFTHDGVVTLSVTAKPKAKSCVLRFGVGDTGIGIDHSRGVDIFSAFQHVQATNGGSGLGLYISQRIVSAMGGSLDVTSIPGQGTTFSFELSVPIAETSDADWPIVEQREIEPLEKAPGPTLPRNAMPDDHALDQLANLALYGRLTDIEHWIEHHANEVAHYQFLALLNDLLERLDFAGVQALALHRKSSSIA